MLLLRSSASHGASRSAEQVSASHSVPSRPLSRTLAGLSGTGPRSASFESMAKQQIGELLTAIGTSTSRPSAFLILGAFTVSWVIFERETLDWHGVATLVTWAMTLLIQRAEHRDTQALQAKLDELIRASETARDSVARIDDKEPEEIETLRSQEDRAGK